MRFFSSLFVTVLLGAGTGYAAPLVQERGQSARINFILFYKR